MIAPEKLPNALYALQGLLIHARFLAYQPEKGKQVAQLLDSAEYLPRLMASESDDTAEFRDLLQSVAQRHQCAYVLQRFDDPMPSKW